MLGMKSQKTDGRGLTKSIDSEKINEAVTTKLNQENMSTSISLNSSYGTQLNKGEIPKIVINNEAISSIFNIQVQTCRTLKCK